MAMLTDSSSKLPVTTVVVSIPTIAGCMQLLYFYLYKKKKINYFSVSLSLWANIRSVYKSARVTKVTLNIYHEGKKH